MGEPNPTPRRGLVPITPDASRLLGWVSHGLAVGVALLFAVLTVTRGVPTNPEGALIDSAIQEPVQYALSALVALSALISWRWPPMGAALMALAGAGLGIFAGVQYEAFYAMGAAVTVMVPAVLLWLSWQHHRLHHEIAILAVVTAALIGATWFGAQRVYDSAFGPTHPDSTATLADVDVVEWLWMGGLGPRSISVTARLDDADVAARLLVTDGDRAWTTPTLQPNEARIVRFDLDDLEPGRSYTFAVEADGQRDRGRGDGTFSTPEDGVASFRVVAASCARVDSNAAVFDAMLAENPLMYLALGDAHYSNIADNSVNTFRVAYDRFLTQPGQAALYHEVPVAYIWDDHDYGPNDADASSPSREAARLAFRENVPTHPLVSDDGAIHRAFSVGRVRFVMTDARSERTGTTVLGAEQLAWLENELVTASGTHGLVVWMNSIPWIGAASPNGDGWSGYPDERRHIADTLAAADVDNLLMVAGDAHMLAYDDGTNSGYASDGSPGFPVFHTAALDRPGSVKGGPYSGGTFPGFGQYGVIDIDDDGTDIAVSLTGKNWKGEVLISEELTFTAD
jgi:hypothetical protein